MKHLDVTPTIETSRRFEEITWVEEQDLLWAEAQIREYESDEEISDSVICLCAGVPIDLALLHLRDQMDVDSDDGVSFGGSDDGHPPLLITRLSDWPHHREPEDEYDPWREIGQWSNQ